MGCSGKFACRDEPAERQWTIAHSVDTSVRLTLARRMANYNTPTVRGPAHLGTLIDAASCDDARRRPDAGP